MLVLGIESTAHTLGLGVAEATRRSGRVAIHSNALDKYPSTREGYVPRKLAEHHEKAYPALLARALAGARVSARDLDAIAYAQGPGIGHALRIGYAAAASLADALGVPLVPVNHGIAHVEVTRETQNARDPLVLYVSGGNTQLAVIDPQTRTYRVLGETLDIGVGNFLDHLGRLLALDPPDAVGVLRAAPSAQRLVSLPYPIKGMNVSFTGLLTFIERHRPSASSAEWCLAAQEHAFAMLTEAAERALCHAKKPEVLVCGGNARNRRLQEMLERMSKEQGARFCAPSDELAGDNGAMIAVTGLRMLAHGVVPRDKEPNQKMRLDGGQKIPW